MGADGGFSIWGPALISGIATMAGAGLSGGLTAGMSRKAREWQTKEYNRQHEIQVEDWNRQNEYNSPLQQRARMEEAGFNPNLAVGDPGNAGSIAQPSNTSPAFEDYGQVGNIVARGGNEVANNLANGYYKQAQISSLDASRALTLAREKEVAAREVSILLANTFNKDTYDIRKSILSNKDKALWYSVQRNSVQLEGDMLKNNIMQQRLFNMAQEYELSERQMRLREQSFELQKKIHADNVALKNKSLSLQEKKAISDDLHRLNMLSQQNDQFETRMSLERDKYLDRKSYNDKMLQYTKEKNDTQKSHYNWLHGLATAKIASDFVGNIAGAALKFVP